MRKPEQIIELEEILGFELSETESESVNHIFNSKRYKTYLCNEKNEIVELNLRNNEITDFSFLQGLSNLTRLDLSENKITDFSFLQSLSNLTRLDLSENKITDFSFLQGLSNLTRLDLSRSQISDFSFLEKLQNLTTLDLWNNRISDISFLKGLNNLTSLNLGLNQISDISPLKDLPNLISLDLSNNQISDISLLKDLPNLTSLILYNNQFSDISFLKDLSNLTSLDLGSNQVLDISFLEDLTGLTGLGLGNNQISDYSLLKSLPNLVYLNLSSNKITDYCFLKDLPNLINIGLYNNQISDISFLQYFTNLISLDLGSNEILDISSLEKLTNLTSLSLYNNQISDISLLQNLKKLEFLNLENNKISHIFLSDFLELHELKIQNNPLKSFKLVNLENIRDLNLYSLKIEELLLQNLPNLTDLNLFNNQISDISFLESLSNIINLKLHNNQISDISPLEKLTKLKSLNLSNNRISDIYFLKNLTNLVNLDLRNNQISNICPLSFLINLTNLNLETNKISDISFLKDLINLIVLGLDGNQISDISFLKDLINLIELNLSNNKISNVSSLKELKQIEKLDLASNQISDISISLEHLAVLGLTDNQISDISNLSGLKKLKCLYISLNKISNVSIEFINSFPKLEEIIMAANPIQNIPEGFFNMNGNVLSEIRAYFNELKKGVIINDRAKLIIVGNGRVGKTSLIKRLQNIDFDKGEKYTHGIQIGNLKKEHLPECKTENLNLSVWDFGGQEIFYATHQFFLSDDAIYILAWTKEENVKAHQERNKETLPTNEKWQSVEYWLDTIRRYATKSPILLVQTHTDCGKEKIDETDFQEFDVSEFLNFSASKGFGLEEIREELTQKLNILPMYGQEFPKTYENVILQITNLKNKGENFVSYTDFMDIICKNANIDKGGESTLLNYLNKTGLIVYYPENPKLKDFIYIDPDWLTKQVYSLINNQLHKTKGEITFAYLEKNLPNYKNLGLLALFKQFDLLFEVEDKDEIFWIAPQYLDKKLEGNKIFDKQLDKSKLALVFRFSRFMPDNVMINFLSRYGSFAKDVYWKNGIYFTKNEVDCIVFKENENELHIWIDKYQERKGTLKEIVEVFSEFGKNAKMEISLDNNDFVNLQELKNDNKKGFKQIKSLQGNPLQIKDFLFLFQNKNDTKQQNNEIMNIEIFKKHFKEAITQEIPDLLEVLENNKDKLTSEQVGTYRNLKNEFFNQPNNFQLESWKAKVLGSIIGLNSELEKMPTLTINLIQTSQTTSNRKLLFLSADPVNQEENDLMAQFARMGNDLKKAKIEATSIFHAKLEDLLMGMSEIQPTMIHFVGHGKLPTKEITEAAKEKGQKMGESIRDGSGLILADDYGKPYHLETSHLENIFKTFTEEGLHFELVFLNSCYSENQANVIRKYADYVIGTNEDIGIENAEKFATLFYRGLAQGNSIPKSFNVAKLSSPDCFKNAMLYTKN